MSYIPNTAAEQQKMLASLGMASADELYRAVPRELRAQTLNLEPGKSEMEVRRVMEGFADANRRYPVIFRGAGSYDHYIPAIVRTVTSKEEFVTAYTPYQAEISQGVLQSIFEYQTMICELTGMDVSNASVYDGATAAAEAVLMCLERRRSGIVLSGAMNPQAVEVIRTYCASRSVPVTVVPAKDGGTDIDAVAAAAGEDTACVCFQQPSYFGVIEDAEKLCALAHEAGAKAVMSVEPIAAAILKTPGECGADVACGEGQPLGLAMSFGGPYLGFMASSKALMRRLPGRIVGQTADDKGNRAFVLTLQAREQHIRREKASSNICSNEALCAMTAAVYMAAMGPDGLTECARQCYDKAHYAAEVLCGIPGVKLLYEKPFFNEFVTACPISAEKINRELAKEGILGGLSLDGGVSGETSGESGMFADSSAKNAILWCVTEKNTKEQIDRLAEIVGEVCAK